MIIKKYFPVWEENMKLQFLVFLFMEIAFMII